MKAADPLRLAFGTLTALPVPAPTVVDRRVAGWAMALAPLVGAVLGVVAGGVAWLAGVFLGPLLVAVLVVAVLGLCTRLIHWDGLADTADGLGSGRPGDEAVAIMRRSDVGPFGVFAVVVVFALQVFALAGLLAAGSIGAVGAVVAAVAFGRCALPVACRSGVPAARPDGLGAAVAGSVSGGRLALGAAGAAGVVVVATWADPRLTWVSAVVAGAAVAVWAFAATTHLRRRLGGMTGDTLGALVETTTAVALVVLVAA